MCPQTEIGEQVLSEEKPFYPEMFDEQDPFDFVDSLLDSFSEDQLCLLEQRIFSAIVRKREKE